MTARCAKPSRCWARHGQSWAHHNVRKDQDETKTRQKSAPRGKSRQDKDKKDSTTTNKQDPQDTPAGRRITHKSSFFGIFHAPKLLLITHVYAYGPKTVLVKRKFLQTRGRRLCWGGVGMLTFFLVRTWDVATLQRSLVSLLRTCCIMLRRCRDLWYPCYVTCCYAAEISGILATLHVATLQRSLVSLLRYMLLRCRDLLWYPCYVTCCYAAEISGILATLHVATLQRSLVSLLRYMLLRCRDLWYPCYVSWCYAAEISGILATLHVATLQRSLVSLLRYMLHHVATLQRSLVSLLRYMLLRCRDLPWYPCYVTCCYAAEISGILATLHVATLQRSLVSLLRYMLLRCRDLWYPCYVTCCYAAEISSSILATLHVATLQRSLVSLLRYMLLRCRDLWYPCYVTCCYFADLWRMSSAAAPPSNAIQARLMLRGPGANNSSPTLWVPGTKMPCYMPKCGNGDSSTSTRSCLRRLQRCCERSTQTSKFGRSNLPLFKWHKWLPRCGKTHILL